MEKIWCLDVALRLGKLIQLNCGRGCVYTRPDDTFVPLRADANCDEARADLFISIHANSSHDAQSARGSRRTTDFLKGSAEAMEVAAREKCFELGWDSRPRRTSSSASLGQRRLTNRKSCAGRQIRSQKTCKEREVLKNRGVRKAPFSADWRGHAVDPDENLVS